MNKQKGFIALLVTAAILGTFGVWIRELNNYFGEFGQVVMRSLVATAIMLLIIAITKVKLFVPKDKQKYLLGFSIAFPLSIVCFTYAATSIKVSNALFMLYVGSMIATFLWGKFAFGESFGKTKFVSVLLLVMGLVIFVYPFDAKTLSVGTLLGLASGLLEGTSHAFRKYLKDVKRQVIVLFQSLSGVIVSVLLLAASKQAFVKEWTMRGILESLLFGALLVVIGYLLAYGFGNYDVNVGTVILASELFFALVINYFVLKESPTTNEMIGGIVIFLGATYANVRSYLSVTSRKLQR